MSLPNDAFSRLRVSLPDDAVSRLTVSLTPEDATNYARFCLHSSRVHWLAVNLFSVSPARKFPGEPGNHRGPFKVRRGVLSKEHELLCRVPPAASQLPCSPLEMKQWGSLSSGSGAPLWDSPGLAQPADSLPTFPLRRETGPCPPGLPAGEHCLPE